jgi:hypothetical protein
MSDDRIVAGQDDGRILGQQRDEEAGQGAGQVGHRPAGPGEGATVTGGVARGQRPGGAEEIGDGAPAGGEDRGAQEYEEAAIGRLGEDGGEGIQHSQGFIG